MLDLSLITSGAGFNGVEYAENDGKKGSNVVKKIKWERANNIWSLKTAFPQYTGHVVRYWNMTVNNWLTFYIFYRIDKVPSFMKPVFGEKGSKVMLTRIASALFHGVYPSYYCFFFLSAVITNVIDMLRLILPTFEDEVELKGKSPFAVKSMMLYAFWCCLVIVTIDSCGIFFMQLDVFKVINLFHSIYWFPLVLTMSAFVIGQVLKMTIGIKQSEKDKRKKKKK